MGMVYYFGYEMGEMDYYFGDYMEYVNIVSVGFGSLSLIVYSNIEFGFYVDMRVFMLVSGLWDLGVGLCDYMKWYGCKVLIYYDFCNYYLIQDKCDLQWEI